ncbi:cytochrome P450 [Dipodascopsis tothii]|uniref:cytochrome P450 n=1 Tax=Dipodascopsis tothii TaxID=44089 RepID=UPI0034CFEAA1
MDLNVTLILAAAVFALCLHRAWLAVQTHLRRQAYCAANSCGPTPQVGRLFFGNVVPLFRSVATGTRMTYLQNLFADHGYTLKTLILGSNIVHTIEPENVKTVLSTRFTDYQMQRHHTAKILLGDGIFVVDGEKWSSARALIRPQFARPMLGKIDMLEPHFQAFVRQIRRDPNAFFDMQQLAFRLTMDAATEFLFGESVGSLENNAAAENSKFAGAFEQSQSFVLRRILAQTFAPLVNSAKDRDAVAEVHDFAERYVDRALRKRAEQRLREKTDPDAKAKESFVFLEALTEQTQDRTFLRDQVLNLLIAGRDTTALLLTWTFYSLLMNPRVFQRLRDEVLDRYGAEPNAPGKEPFTFESLKNFDYMRHTLNEVLRLYPSVPQNYRIAVKDTMLPTGGGPDGKQPVFVPKGGRVVWTVFCMHRRKDLWGPDADLFRPERWAEGRTHSWDYVPFNGGPRICLGQQFALTEASYLLARFLQTFDTIESLEDPAKPPRMNATLVLQKTDGLYMRAYCK